MKLSLSICNLSTAVDINRIFLIDYIKYILHLEWNKTTLNTYEKMFKGHTTCMAEPDGNPTACPGNYFFHHNGLHPKL